MNRRVFLSHTTEIRDYPEGLSFLNAAMDGVRQAGWVAVEMQDFLPSRGPTAAELERKIESCDVFFGILGFKWGAEVPGHAGKSYCKYESDFAQRAGKDCRFFLVGENAVGFPVGYVDWIPRGELEKQKAYREEIKGRICAIVRNPTTLQMEINRTLVEIEPPPPPKERLTKKDLQPNIDAYLRYLSVENYDQAWKCFRAGLNEQLDLILNDNDEHLQLIRKLFREDIDSEPPLSSRENKAAALNALARAYKNVGEPRKAVQIYKRQLALLTGGDEPHVKGLAFLANALRLTGDLSEAEDTARKMLAEAAKSDLPKWQAYALYWNGILYANRGAMDQGLLLLRQAQVLFEASFAPDDPNYAEGVARTYAHLAQIELWLGHPKVALGFAREAVQLEPLHRQPRELIFARRLSGMANLALGNLEVAKAELDKARDDARKSRYLEEELAASIGLAEHARIKRRYTAARQLLDEVERGRLESGGYALLLSDFDNARSQVYRDEGNRDEAVEAAKRALKEAWCDGPSFCYYWGLERARKHLVELGVPPLEIPEAKVLHPERQLYISTLLNRKWIDEQQIRRAELRTEFTERLHTVTGPYRYAPTKFVQMFKEDWPAIRSVVTGKEVSVKPQFIEIHVGHPCNLSCSYCRDELRKDVPGKQQRLSRNRLLKVIDSIRELNNGAFVRFSGLIGEPLVHREIVDVFEAANARCLGWGLTTNGILMKGDGLQTALLGARYVHVSVDAGSDETYQHLKRGKPGDFEIVINNIALLREARERIGKGPEIVVSFLLQEENYSELRSLAERVKAIAVDSLEVKMQHFDERRMMSQKAVAEVYDAIDQMSRDLSDDKFRIIVVQGRDEAFRKIQPDAQPISFKKCYAGLLGLNHTIDPAGTVWACCQYYQNTLGSLGNIKEKSLESIWTGPVRRTKLKVNPTGVCVNCSPSDEFVNKFVHFLQEAHERDDSFLDWIEKEVAAIWPKEVR